MTQAMWLLLLLGAVPITQFLPPPPPPPIGPQLERTATISVKTNPSVTPPDDLQFVVTVRNEEKRAYCIPSEAFHTGRQQAPYEVGVSSTDADLAYQGHWADLKDEKISAFVAIPPGQSVSQTISAGLDYKFPSQRKRYVATFAVRGFYCDDFNLGNPFSITDDKWRGANIIFGGQSAPFTR